MDSSHSPSSIDWLAVVIRTLQGLLGTVERLGLLGVGELRLVYIRLNSIAVRMDRLAARFRAGTLVVRGPRELVAAGPVERTRRVPEVKWPRQSAWLVRMVGYQAAGMALQFEALLRTQEMVELLLAGPQAARILRPMCRMLGVETSHLDPRAPMPVFLQPVARVSVRRVRAKVPPIDWGNIPLPRGILTHVRRLGLKPVR